MNDPKTILIIQTAFIGDTILASQFARAVKMELPNTQVHFFLRKGNESVIQGLNTVDKVFVWDKQGGKVLNLIRLILQLRKYKYDTVFNLHRHFNSGLITLFMRARQKVGFKQNPLSFFYTHRVDHRIPHKEGKIVWHEVQRNLQLLRAVKPPMLISNNAKVYRPDLPLTQKNFDKIAPYLTPSYFVIAPASVWFTKAWSQHKFAELTAELVKIGKVYFIGAASDSALCDEIRKDLPNTENLCGQLNLLDSAALMKTARRVFVNDSAPLHLASCVNARTTAIFCSTVPDFGYTPLSDDSIVIDTGSKLSCRPCGLHGLKKCPLDHFKCSEDIEIKTVLSTVV